MVSVTETFRANGKLLDLLRLQEEYNSLRGERAVADHSLLMSSYDPQTMPERDNREVNSRSR